MRLKKIGQSSGLAFILILATVATILAQSAVPKIDVVYPKEGQELTAYDSTFILGNVTPGAELKINGYPIKVYPKGGFLAYIPIQPGEFQFELIASNRVGATTSTLTVKVPERFKTTPSDSFRIEEKGRSPEQNLVLTAGDLLQAKFRGTPNCQGMFKIEGLTDWMDMAESQLRISAPESREVFSTDEIMDTLTGKGVYSGLYRVKGEDNIDSAKIYFGLVKSVATAPESLKNYLPYPEIYQRLCADSIRFSLCTVDSAPGRVTIIPSQIPQVVELIDTSQIIPRIGPGLLFWYLFQASGTKAIADGKAGKWVRLKLTEDEYAWIEEEKVRYLPLGTQPPASPVASIRTEKDEQGVKVTFSMAEKLPFRAASSEDPGGISLDIFYATSNVNFIRYDAEDEIIKNISWTQIANDHFQAQVALNHKQQWGYQVSYQGTNLILEIKAKPQLGQELHGLTVTVDAGHSGDDGSIGPTRLTEKEVNLQIAKRLKRILEQHGATVVMTRNGMENVPLYDRPKIAQQNHTDIYISIHNNAHPDGVNPFVNTGTSVYYYHPHSEKLAESVHQQLVKTLDIGDQGLYQGNFAVLRPPGYLSILIECAFIIHPEQEQLLRQGDFQEKIVRAIYKGLAKFLTEVK